MPDAVGDAQHMAIDREGRARRGRARAPTFAVLRPTPAARQRLHVGRHLSAVPLDQGLAHTEQHLGLLRKKPVATICGSSSAAGGGDEPLRIRVALEERRRDLVHARVGRLRREDRRDEQLERAS
jgi:hypothetical protein